MFIVQLTFSTNKARAGEFMAGHNAWLQQGFDDGIFLLAGSLGAGAGGGILAHNVESPALESRVEQDPFVAESVVQADIQEITPARADDRLAFLLN